MRVWNTLGFRAALVSLLLLLSLLLAWGLGTQPVTGTPAPAATASLTPEQIEYLKMMGKDPGALSAGEGKASGFPTPLQTEQVAWKQLSNPF